MGYLVDLTARAQRDFVQMYEEINAAHSDTALKSGWYHGARRASC